jgi:hypothetical protein
MYRDGFPAKRRMDREDSMTVGSTKPEFSVSLSPKSSRSEIWSLCGSCLKCGGDIGRNEALRAGKTPNTK